ncbi:MAG: hypothetical protein QXR29_01595, partial [Candidatus Micrarchaeaceae archaeon]
NYISGSGRALCVKGSAASAYENLGIARKKEIAERYGCIMFTNKEPHPGVADSELRFIRDVLGIDEDDPLLVGIGEPSKVEEAIKEINLSIVGAERSEEGAKLAKLP